MKRLMIGLFAASAALSAVAAKTYYVDPTSGGSDDYNGEAEVWEGGESLVGPKHTLVGVTAVANQSGDVIIALPGTFAEKLADPTDDNTYSRVTLPNGVTLRSRDGAEKTIIMGQSAEFPVKSCEGCGTGVVARCIRFLGNNTLEGFTLTGGRVYATGTQTGKQGGAITGSGVVVDCICSNNVAVRGGVMTSGTFIGCRFLKNGTTYTGSVCHGKPLCVNCFFDGNSGYDFYNTSAGLKLYNCTFGPNDTQSNNDGSSTTGAGTKFYNCIDLSSKGGKNVHYWHSVMVKKHADAILEEGGFVTNATAIAVNADGTLKAESVAKDTGTDADYLAGLTAALKERGVFDLYGVPRFLNGSIDMGCCEYDWRVEFSDTLSPLGVVEVTNATEWVTLGENCVSIGTNAVLEANLKAFAGAASTTYSFFAKMTGSGTLKVYVDGADDPVAICTGSDETEIKFTRSGDAAVRLVYEGTDGAAEVRNFTNCSFVNLEVPKGTGIAIDGEIEPGVNYIAEGSKTFTVSRKDDGTVACLGVEVNGEFKGFYDYPDGLTFTVSADDRGSSVEIVAIYREGPQEWFVDDVNGNDGYLGLYTNRAFKTLARAATNEFLAADETVWVLPGVYADGVCNPDKIDTSTALNRLTVPAGVVFRSVKGAKETVIQGAKANRSPSSGGCGTNAVRCVSLGSGSQVVGFTLCGGRTVTQQGAAVIGSGGYAVDCIITNNCAGGRGGAIGSGLTCVRCYFSDNESEVLASVGYENATYFNCYFYNNKKKSYIHYGNGNYFEMYNCTCNCDYKTDPQAGPRGKCRIYNCLFLNPLEGVCAAGTTSYFYNCRWTSAPSGKSGAENVIVDCKKVDAADVPIDPEGRPLAGNVCIDAGSNLVYTAKFPSAVEGEGLDIVGSQRIYNQKIDIGCGEYDWRGDFAKRLATKGVSVEAASANVTTNDLNGLVLFDGDALKLKLTTKTDGKASLKTVVAGVATLTVKVGETEVPGVDGLYSFDVPAGETVVEISFSGTGTATLSDVTIPKTGMLLLFR